MIGSIFGTAGTFPRVIDAPDHLASNYSASTIMRISPKRPTTLSIQTVRLATLIYWHPMHGDSGMRRLNLNDKGMRDLVQQVYSYEAKLKFDRAVPEAGNQAGKSFNALSQQIFKEQQKLTPQGAKQWEARKWQTLDTGFMKKLKACRDSLMGTSARGKTGSTSTDKAHGEKSVMNTRILPSK